MCKNKTDSKMTAKGTAGAPTLGVKITILFNACLIFVSASFPEYNRAKLSAEEAVDEGVDHRVAIADPKYDARGEGENETDRFPGIHVTKLNRQRLWLFFFLSV
jgi:hypothetical protein